MIALPIALALFGYWVLYAGIKHSSLLDAYSCSSSSRSQTQSDQAGTINVGGIASVNTSCTQRPGDTRIPLPGGGFMLWRPIGSGALGQLNGQLLGPC